MTATITAPGVYDIDEARYHADPVVGGSLSSSGARLLLDCPAKFRWARDNPRPPKREFDIGHAVHTVVLGSGAEIVVIDAKTYATKAAQAERDAAYEAGRTPLLVHEYARVQAMAAAVRSHRLAGALLSPKRGTSEATLVAQDPATGVWMRARPDKLPFQGKRRMLMSDLKSAHSVRPDALSKAVWDHGYYVQAPYYLRVARLLDLCDDQAAFMFVFVEKEPPHLIAVVELTPLALAVGRLHMGNALVRYATCTAENSWPGYADGLQEIGLPPHIERRYEKETWL
jgi:hypothetical protein